MSAGNDDTIASSAPTISGGTSEVAEVVAGRYRVARWLGGGGMGRVYEVLDTELGERVALKVLRAGLSDDAIERFRREVRLTRRIQHRNVARMFDIGEHHGDKFLTMELVDGAALTRELGAPLPWPRLQHLATQLCAGLAAAHQAGVVHRDLKPDNVLIERATDRVVITDFGIARSGDDASVTQVGALVGTPRYMAPEQLAGTEVDARADVFALGVMLYEMATGTRPWAGDNPIAIAVAQATQPPRPFSSPTAPPAYAALVARCLELDRDRRPATAAEVGAAIAGAVQVAAAGLRAPAPVPPSAPASPASTSTSTPTPVHTTAPGPSETTLAVLPLSCAPGDEYLADGVLDDLVDTLSATSRLRVRPAGVVRTHATLDPRELGRQLEVDHVVVGSLRRISSGLRISARLVGVADGFQIWGQRIDCGEAEVLAAAEQLARGVAQALSTRAAASARPLDPRAVELYLRARAELRRYWGEYARSAMELLEQAAAYAPDAPQIVSAYALAAVQSWLRVGTPALRARADEVVQRALATGHGEAFLAASNLALNRGELDAAGAHLGTALARAPMSAQVHEAVGRLLVEVDPSGAGRPHLDTAVGLDPSRAQIVAVDLARLDAMAGDWASVDRQVALLLADPDPPVSQLGGIIEARLSVWRRDPDRLAAAFELLGPRLGTSRDALRQLLDGWRAGRPFDGEEWTRIMLSPFVPDEPHRFQLVTLQRTVEAAMMIDQPAYALRALRAACDAGLIDLVWLDRCPLFAPLTAEPAFQAIRAEIADRAARVLAAFRATPG